MYKRWLRQYSGLLILGLLLIAAYRLFDNFMVVGDYVIQIADILLPFIIGAILAYFLYTPANALERVFKKQHPTSWIYKNARLVSTLIVFFSFMAIAIATVMFVIPMVGENLMEFVDRMPSYLKQIEEIFISLETQFGIPNMYDVVDETITSYIDSSMSITSMELKDLLDIVSHGADIVSTILSVLMAIVVAPYLLYERGNLQSILDHVLLTMISARDLRFIHRYAHKVHKIFSSFIFGKAIDSLIIGIMAYVGFMLLDLKFVALLAIVIGVTNMIPYFGPFFGGIPVTIVAVITTGLIPGIWTGLFVFALQQFDGLILGPYILGESVGVSALWIIFAITFFGGTLGFIGMVIGVPLIAAIRMFYHDLIRYGELKEIIRKNHLIE